MLRTMNKKCQVFTPVNYVEELLESVEYVEQLYGKRILENSCGDGNILVSIVQRYIDACKKEGYSRTKIKNGLERDVYGIEIDSTQFDKCIRKLNDVLLRNNIGSVRWKIYNCDYLKWKDEIKFHFIIGNPPYITYSELTEPVQKYLKKNFASCKVGKFDYCYAFIEKSMNSLEQNGKMAYLIPSSIFKTVFGANLRNILKDNVVKIKDYTQQHLFDNALVKSSIMIIEKGRMQNILHYEDVALSKSLIIPKKQLDDKWFFTNDLHNGTRRFGDYFKVSHVVATLLNEAFVLKDGTYTENEYGILYNGYNIEKDIIKDTATPRTLRYKKREKIIFPYIYTNNGLKHFSEDEFKKRYPNAYAYLNEYKAELKKRKSDDSAKWFEYGRSQAIGGLNCKKILISTIVTGDVLLYTLSKKCIPYAGMYVVPREQNKEYDLETAKNILQSTEFKQYIMDVGIHISGSSLRITSKDIEEFRF